MIRKNFYSNDIEFKHDYIREILNQIGEFKQNNMKINPHNLSDEVGSGVLVLSKFPLLIKLIKTHYHSNGVKLRQEEIIKLYQIYKGKTIGKNISIDQFNTLIRK